MATPKRVATKDPLAVLCALVVGEKHYTLADANAMGYFTIKQMAEESGLSEGMVDRQTRRRFQDGKLRRVKVSGGGGAWAYGPA